MVISWFKYSWRFDRVLDHMGGKFVGGSCRLTTKISTPRKQPAIHVRYIIMALYFGNNHTRTVYNYGIVLWKQPCNRQETTLFRVHARGIDSFEAEDGLQLLQTVVDGSRYKSTSICGASRA